MKLALCLSGQPRSYAKTYEYLKQNLLDVHDVDIFIHTWKPKGVANYLQMYEDLNALYQPKYLVMDDPLPETVNNHMFVPNLSHPANFVTSMFYSLYRANDCRARHEMTHDTKYDFVIRSRLDFALNTQIDFESLSKDIVYVPKDAEGDTLFNDQFAVASVDNMNCYASTFLTMSRLYQRGVPLCGHRLLENNLHINNIKYSQLDVNHPFVDGKFNIGRHSIIRDDMTQWVDPKIWGY